MKKLYFSTPTFIKVTGGTLFKNSEPVTDDNGVFGPLLGEFTASTNAVIAYADPVRSSSDLAKYPKRRGYRAAFIGDSRTQDIFFAFRRKGGRNWFNWANAYMGQTFAITDEYATSGLRSDEFLNETNFEYFINDPAELAVIGYPVVNDISQAYVGYTSVEGQAITLANVVDTTIARLLDRVNRLLAAGKEVVVCTEPGATAMNASQAAQVHVFNEKFLATFQGMAGVHVFDPRSVIWSRATTGTVIAFKTGYSTDGTHATTKQGQAVGKFAARTFFPTFVAWKKNYGNRFGVSSNQLFPNAGFATLTGGTTSNITGTDPVPANCQVSAATAGLSSYTLTSATADDDSGNELTLTITTTGAVSVRFIMDGISSVGIAYTAYMVGGIDINVISSSNCKIYSDCQIYTNQISEDGYDLYAGDVTDNWVTSGSTDGWLRTASAEVRPGSIATSGHAVNERVILNFTAAGTCVIKLRDPSVYRV